MDEADKCLMNCEMFGRQAEYFESHIVPLWQDVYDSLATRAKVSKGDAVLDVGAGTGEVALRVSSLVGDAGKVVAIDLQDEMLSIARRKAKARGIGNLSFQRMSMESMEMPGSHFDAVVGNYSLCCCDDYEAALRECFRVLKPGGRLTYNHGGPTDPAPSKRAYELFEEYKPKNPSKRLKALRASDEAQMAGFEKYRDPQVVLGALERAGYRRIEATMVPRKIRYPDAASYVARMLEFDCRSEVEEMDAADVDNFRSRAIRELRPLSKGPGFNVEDEAVYFTGTKGRGR